MTLGDYVRVVRTFLEAFRLAEAAKDSESGRGSASEGEQEGAVLRLDEKIISLGADLQVSTTRTLLLSCVSLTTGRTQAYQDELRNYGIKDDRIRRPLSRPIILYRLLVRLPWALFLFSLSLPGLVLWLPVFVTTFFAVRSFKRTGPIWDTWDEIAQYKLVYGLISGLCVWGAAVLVTFPIALFTIAGVPLLMWMSLRWFEDAVASLRACAALTRLFIMPRRKMVLLQATRQNLYKRIMNLAVHVLGLPEDPETYFAQVDSEDTGKGKKDKGRVRGRWESKTKYFSIRRRRKRDWNETLRLYDKVDYPDDPY